MADTRGPASLPDGTDPHDDTPGIVVLYAHDALGNLMREVVVDQLRQRGRRVRCDRDPSFTGALSFKAWLARRVEFDYVIVVLSPDFIKYFAAYDESPEHQGLRFERNFILEKLSRHTSSKPVPVLFVAHPDQSVENLPYAFTLGSIARLDPDTSQGIDDIDARLTYFYSHHETTCPDAPDTSRLAGTTVPTYEARSCDAVIRDLWAIDPRDRKAVTLVRELMTYAGSRDRSENLAYTFPVAERIVRLADDPELMLQLVDCCRAALGQVTPRGNDALLVAGMLISGQAWALARRKDLTGALRATQRGVELASSSPAGSLTQARGNRALGYLHRELAERPSTTDRKYHLRRSRTTAKAAYRAIRRSREPASEVARALHVLARSYFAEYLLLGRRGALRRAAVLADTAAKNYPADRRHDQHALLLLRAELALARGDYGVSSDLVDRVETMVRKRIADKGQGGPSPDLAARGRLLRAELDFALQTGSTVPISEETEVALKVFEDEGMYLFASASRWLLIKLDQGRHDLADEDVQILEWMCPDPHERVLAVCEHVRRTENGTRRRRRRVAEWRDIVKVVRQHPRPATRPDGMC